MNRIDGKALAEQVRNSVKEKVAAHKAKGNRPPCLAVVLVGDDPASQVYVGHKEKACNAVGITSRTIRMPDNASEAQVLTEIRKLSQDQEVDGILLQLPLPNHLHRDNIVRTIPANKDVDGLVPENQGLLCWGHPGLRPCTPLGIVELIKSTGIEISGKRAVVVGRSILVGLPVAQLLIHENATVTVVHSKSKNPESLAREADILVVAAGKPLLVDDSWIKRGAIVIDVGIHRVDGKIVGDVNFASAERVAGYLTPVPGGVGPMTIAMLLVNCLRAYEDRRQS